MTFVTAGLAVAGVLGMAIPIIIFLLWRQRRTPIEWGAMRFLLEAYRKHRRRLRFEQLLLLAVLFRTIETFKLFDIVYIITEGGPGSSTETIAVFLYRNAFQFFQTSRSAALAYIVLFIVIVLTNLYLYAVNRREEEVG